MTMAVVRSVSGRRGMLVGGSGDGGVRLRGGRPVAGRGRIGLGHRAVWAGHGTQGEFDPARGGL